MFKLLCLFGCFLPSLYRMFADFRRKRASSEAPARLSGEAAAPFINFAPKLTIITKVDVPIRSRNAQPELEQVSAEKKSPAGASVAHSLLQQKVLSAREKNRKAVSSVMANQNLPGAAEPIPLKNGNGTKIQSSRISRSSLNSF